MACKTILGFSIGLVVLGLSCVAIRFLVVSALEAWRRSSTKGRLSFCIAAFGAVLYAGGKARRMVVGLSLAASQIGNPVTDQDVDRGFRQISVQTNSEAGVSIPSNSVVVGNWHVRGAYKDRVYIPFGDFDWVLGSNAINRVSVFTGGRARPSPRDAFREVSAVGGDLLAIQGRSTLWYQDGPGVRTVGWDDFSVGADTNISVNASISWYEDGSIRVASNEVEKVYVRVSPSDWDGDGLLNEKDDSPYVYDGEYFGPENNLPDGCNSNAYCSISLAATGPDAEVRFEGDGPSNYPDPHFMARSGATNEVLILIGKAYRVLSDQPIAIVDSSDPETEIRMADRCSAWVVRPVEILAEVSNLAMPVSSRSSEHDHATSEDFVMSVSPSCLGGVFQWMDNCCAIVGSGPRFSFVPNPNCTCGGCEANGAYVYEGYRRPAYAPMCRCYFSSGDPHWSLAQTPREAGVSVSFSKDVVIFEDRYENTPGEWVEKNSTQTKLTITAWGGSSGSTLTVRGSNLNKLSKVSGANLPLAPVSVPAGMEVSYEVVYEGCSPSEASGDVSVLCSLDNLENGGAAVASAGLTVIKCTFAAVNVAPGLSSQSRHCWGVLEEFRYSSVPTVGGLVWRFRTQEDEIYPFDSGRVILPPSTNGYGNGSMGIEVQAGGTTLVSHGRFLEPRVAVDNLRISERVQMVDGEAGLLLMVFDSFVFPRHVSFQGVEMTEIADESGNCPHSGYYDDVVKGGPLSHSAATGAGSFVEVDACGQWGSDECGRGSRYEGPWSNGWKEWQIPVGWGVAGRLMGRLSENPTTQRFSLSADGKFGIAKYQFFAERDIHNNVWTNGIRMVR